MQKNLIILSAIITLTIVLFSNSVKNEFIILDDPQYVTENPEVINLNLKDIFTGYTYGHYQPLAVLSYAIDYKIWGMDSSGFRTTNIFLHIVNIILLFYFARMLTGRTEVAAIVALLFAIHPMRVESVVWISERKDMLYGMFYIASLILYLLYSNRDRKRNFYLLSLFAFLLSLFTKSMAVTLPVVLVLIDFYRNRENWKKRLPEKIPFFVLSLIFGLIAIRSQQSASLIESSLDDFTLINRFLLICYALATYILKFFYPGNLLFLTDYPQLSNGSLPTVYFLAPLFLIIIIVGVYKARKFRKHLVFGLLFFLITIAPVLQIIPVAGFLWDHYTYIPYIGLFLIIGLFYVWVVDNKFSYARKIRIPLQVILGIFVAFLFFTTIARNKIWKDSETLFTYTAEKQPDNEAAYLNLGIERTNKGNWQAAIKDFSYALEIRPSYASAFHCRGIARFNANDSQGALQDFDRALQIRPEYAASYNQRGRARGSLNDHSGAIVDFIKSIRLEPGNYEAYYNLGQAYAYTGNYPEALKALDQSLKLAPYYDIAFAVRGSVNYQSGNLNAACQDWRKASSLGNQHATGLMQKYCK